MDANIPRFFITFTILLACFALSADSSMFSLLHIPNHPATAAVCALIFTALVFRVNLWVVGSVCFFFYLANAGLPTAGIIPRPEVSLAIAVTLACLPTMNELLSG